MRSLQGRFSFWLTPTGNLLGEYSNNHTPHPHVEAAQRIDPQPSQGFAGRYQSVWLEPDLEPRCVILSITGPEGQDEIYQVSWERKQDNGMARLYEGTARIFGGILAGEYRSAS